MQIKIEIDDSCKEPKVIILTDKMSQEVNDIVNRLSGEKPDILAGFRDDTLTILDKSEILRVYAENGKVIVSAVSGEYTLRQRLYEVEERLAKDGFARISNSEIVNLKKVKQFDLSLAGTICVMLVDGTVTYVSRRYVSKIKNILGI